MDEQHEKVMMSPVGWVMLFSANTLGWVSRIYAHVRGWVMHFWTTTFQMLRPMPPILIDRSLNIPIYLNI